MTDKMVPQHYANLAIKEQREQLAALRAECERLKESVNASRAEATLRFEESQQWRQKAQVIDDGLCMAKERIAELEAALTEIHELLSNYRHGTAKARAAAALKGDTSEIRRRASPDDKHPEDRIVH